MEVKSALTASEAKIQQLLKVNCHLSEELRLMQSKVSKFMWNRRNEFGFFVWIVSPFMSLCHFYVIIIYIDINYRA